MFDIAIIGGGPAGAAAAIRAAHLGLSAAIVEAAPARDFRIGETVPPDIEPLLRQLRVWDAFWRDDHLPAAGACSAWGEPDLAWQDGFTFKYGGGWHLDRARFDAMLLSAAESAGATLFCGRRVTAAERTPANQWRLSLADDSQCISARFLVDAGGRNAIFARGLGARCLKVDRLVAVFAVIPLDAALPSMLHTLVEAIEHGWWYATRVPAGNAVVSLFTDADIAHRIGCLRPEGWQRLLAATRYVYPTLGCPAAPVRVSSVSAVSHCLDRLHGPGWLAVGDAATAWDPLTSAGLFLALEGGMEAADGIVSALNGEAGALETYGRRIQQRFTSYLFERRSYYALETRWHSSEFWRRRAGIQPQEKGPHEGTDAIGRAAAVTADR